MEASIAGYADLEAIQALLARNAALEETLAAIVRMIERQVPGSFTAVLLYDKQRNTLSFCAGELVPEAYRGTVRNLPVDRDSGIAGRAAYYRKPVFCEDIFTDPACIPYRALSRELGVKSGWGYPVVAHNGELLGALASYYAATCPSSEIVRTPVARAASLVAIAIERDRDQRVLREAEQRYQSLFSDNPDAIYAVDTSGVLRSVNRAACEISGYAEEQLIGLHYEQLHVPEELDRIHERFRRTLNNEPQHYESTIVDALGRPRVLEITTVPGGDGERVTGVYGIAKDITDQRARETQLRLLKRSVEVTANGIVIADATQPDHPLVYVNEAFLQLTGYTRDEVIGENCRFLLGADSDHEARRRISQRLAQARDVRVRLLNYRKDGSTFWNDLYIAPVPDEAGRITHFVGVQQDVTVQKAHEDSLAFQATHEPLTGLPNRALLAQRLDEMFERAREKDRLIAVLYIDLDDFKPFNDTLGHSVGDQLLISVARSLSALLGHYDTLAALGGDEFVIVLGDLETEDQASALAERALALIARTRRVAEHEIHVTASIGIALNNQPVEQPGALLQQADMAMYIAKRSGRNTYHWYVEAENTTLTDRVSLRRQLHQAVASDAFELYYQPLIRTDDASVESVEALIRWHHPTRGMLLPGHFIALAEHTGQIVAIGDWALRRACHTLTELNENMGLELAVTVNISAIQFHRRSFLDVVIRTLEETGLPPRLLKIELTESVFMENTEVAIDIVRRLRGAGVDVFIDDFGTGFSSLAYLKNLPVNKIKIDRSFIRDVMSEPGDAAITQGVISMAHHLGLKVVAEGVETNAQRAFLAQHGCDSLQGFLFARPMPLAQLRDYLIGARSASRPLPQAGRSSMVPP